MDNEDDYDSYDDGEGSYTDTDAVVYILDNKMMIEFGVERSVTLELPNAEEQEIVKALLADPNFWARFVSSISAALANR
jgi:hypothetical protein